MFLQEITRALAPWNALYSNSKAVSTAVTSVHVLSLMVGGGLAIAADRTTLRFARRTAPARAAHLEELHAVHRPVLLALVVLFVSGVLLTAADIETFVGSAIFWVKLGFVAVLLVNGIALVLTENRLRGAAPATDALWKRMRVLSVASLALWMLTVALGTLLVGFA
jgi:hypothetical protein